MKFYKEASSKEKEQTTLITFCDSNGKELKGTTRKIVKVKLGEKTTVTLPNVEGYEPADHNYEVSIQGQTSGVVCKKITYCSDKMETIVLNFCDKNGKKLAKDQTVEVEVGEEQKVELPKISGYLPPDNQYTITVSGMKNGTSVKKIVYTKIPQGTAIKYGYRVKVTSKKYALYKDFSWKKANINPYNNTYAAKYQYHHENGTTYLSLYTLKGKWVGYIDVKATKKLGAINTPAQGKAIRYGKNVKIISKKYTLYKNFDWKKASTNPYKKTYKAKYQYKHENGTTYLALYTKNGKFVGYINRKAAKVIK